MGIKHRISVKTQEFLMDQIQVEKMQKWIRSAGTAYVMATLEHDLADNRAALDSINGMHKALYAAIQLDAMLSEIREIESKIAYCFQIGWIEGSDPGKQCHADHNGIGRLKTRYELFG
jgi:hypothetical protein